MSVPPESNSSKKKPSKDNAKEPEGKEKFIRMMISGLTDETVSFYARGERIYIDTVRMGGRGLMMLESSELISFILGTAKRTDNLLLRSADAQLIVDQVRYHATQVAKPLSPDPRSCRINGTLWINPNWKNGKLIRINSGNWTIEDAPAHIFAPLPQSMTMPIPIPAEATAFPILLKKHLLDFGQIHSLLSATCGTMLLPADFVHPFIAFVGQQARGKSTTMKCLIQLIDPAEGGELMSVGKDRRDLLALCAVRHCVALDNVSSLPFDDDIFSQMYNGMTDYTRKFCTNDDLNETRLPRVRLFINGIGNAFHKSDSIDRCLLIEHPDPLAQNGGKFKTLTWVMGDWEAALPELLGSLLSAIAIALQKIQEAGGIDICLRQHTEARFGEYDILGELIAQAMGIEKGVFGVALRNLIGESKSAAIDTDDCAQLVVAWLNGERAGQIQIPDFEDSDKPTEILKSDHYLVSCTSLFAEIMALAKRRNYAVFSLKWLNSNKSLSAAITRSIKNIENSGWLAKKEKGGDDKGSWKFTKII